MIKFSSDAVVRVDGVLTPGERFAEFTLEESKNQFLTTMRNASDKTFNLTFRNSGASNAFELLRSVECQQPIQPFPEMNMGGFAAAASNVQGELVKIEYALYNEGSDPTNPDLNQRFKDDLIFRGVISNVNQEHDTHQAFPVVSCTFHSVNRLWVRQTNNVIVQSDAP